MVILLVLPAGVAAASKKQSLLNWLKRTFQGGEEDLGADKAFASGAVAAANLFPAITDGTNQPPPPVVGPSPPLLDQIRELFATLGLPLSSLAHINDLNANDIILSLSAVMPAKIVHLQVGRVIVVDEVTTLELTNVADSRCPSGAQCITSGKATVSVTVNQEGLSPYNVLIDLGRSTRLKGGYALTCEEIYPLPAARASSVLVSNAPSTEAIEGSKATVAQEDYNVQLMVTLPAERMTGLVEGVLKWTKANGMIRGYVFSERRMCFCRPATLRPVTLQVGAWSKTVTGFYNDEHNEQVPSEALAEYKTVGDLFLLLGKAYAENADRVEATFDPILGYPASIYIDQTADVKEDDIMYEAYALKIS